MPSYGQFYPATKSAEVLGNPWSIKSTLETGALRVVGESPLQKRFTKLFPRSEAAEVPRVVRN